MKSIIVEGQGTIFLAGPPLVKAATGEVISAEELGGAQTHGRKSGVVDHVAANDEQALLLLRQIVGTLDPARKVQIALKPRARLSSTRKSFTVSSRVTCARLMTCMK